jgi:uncharacterized protein YktA (UPF0223 family)
MRFTTAMEAAYHHGVEMSRLQHAYQSMKGVSGYPYPPDQLLSEYTSEHDRAAFCAGWMDGTGSTGGTARASLEGR